MTSLRTVITPKASGPLALGPGQLLRLLYGQRHLIGQLAKRQVETRFRGSYFGALLVFVNPLLLLTAYALVLVGVLGVGGADRVGFVLRLFAAIVMFSVFQDTIGRSPTLITGNPNFVKKVVFPLEVLSVAEVLAATLLASASLLILLAALVVTGRFQPTALWFPVIVPPLLMVTLGVSWLVASLGVFVRDLASSIGVLLTTLSFLTPVFYELEQLQEWRWLAQLNPLAILVDTGCGLLVRGRPPDWVGIGGAWLVGALLMCLGFAWFRATKRGFADVL